MEGYLDDSLYHTLNSSLKDAPKEFYNHTIIKPHYLGGKKQSNFTVWKTSIQQNRVPVKITLKSFSDLMNLMEVDNELELCLNMN